MKHRTFLWAFVSFLLGMGVAYGLVSLDRHATVPRLERTDVFEVVTRDGTVLRLSYAEIEREREELLLDRERPPQRSSAAAKRNGPEPGPRSPSPDPAPAQGPFQETEGERPSEKNLKDLFARIFSQPIMQDLMQAQIAREAGELADVLDLTDEQLEAVEEELEKRKPGFPSGAPGPSPESAPERAEPETPLQEALQPILTPEQYRRYREYTEKKKALAGSPALDRELFELGWRLKLTGEQEGPVREILKEQRDKMGQIFPSLEGEAPPEERLERHLERRAALNRETEEKMKTVLEEAQYEAFLRYQAESDTETRLLKHLIEEEQAEETPATQ